MGSTIIIGETRPGRFQMNDLRLAFRALRSTPIVSAVAILSLALGIGANTAIFSLVNSLLLRALPVKDPQQLALVTESGPGSGGGSWTNPIWEQIRERRHELFDDAFAWGGQRFNLAEGGETQFVDGVYASAGGLDTLGARPMPRRTLAGADDARGGRAGGRLARLGSRLWHRRSICAT